MKPNPPTTLLQREMKKTMERFEKMMHDKFNPLFDSYEGDEITYKVQDELKSFILTEFEKVMREVLQMKKIGDFGYGDFPDKKLTGYNTAIKEIKNKLGI